jgi:hypothetical protein
LRKSTAKTRRLTTSCCESEVAIEAKFRLEPNKPWRKMTGDAAAAAAACEEEEDKLLALKSEKDRSTVVIVVGTETCVGVVESASAVVMDDVLVGMKGDEEADFDQDPDLCRLGFTKKAAAMCELEYCQQRNIRIYIMSTKERVLLVVVRLRESEDDDDQNPPRPRKLELSVLIRRFIFDVDLWV